MMLSKDSLKELEVVPDADEEQFSVNGIDLRIKEIREVDKHQLVGITDDGVRYLPLTNKIDYNNEDSKLYILEHDKQYYVRLDKVNIPKNIGGMLQVRSTFNRCGLNCTTSIIDANFSGHIWVMVYSPFNDIMVCDNERLLQMVLFELDNETEGYDGYYQEK